MSWIFHGLEVLHLLQPLKKIASKKVDGKNCLMPKQSLDTVFLEMGCCATLIFSRFELSKIITFMLASQIKMYQNSKDSKNSKKFQKLQQIQTFRKRAKLTHSSFLTFGKFRKFLWKNLQIQYFQNLQIQGFWLFASFGNLGILQSLEFLER